MKTQPNSEPSDAARKCWNEIEESQGKGFTYVHSTELEIIQRHLDAYHSEQSKELRESHRELVRDKELVDWLQDIYSQQLKNNPEVPFGILTVPLDLNYSSLRNACHAAMKGTKGEVER